MKNNKSTNTTKKANTAKNNNATAKGNAPTVGLPARVLELEVKNESLAKELAQANLDLQAQEHLIESMKSLLDKEKESFLEYVWRMLTKPIHFNRKACCGECQ